MGSSCVSASASGAPGPLLWLLLPNLPVRDAQLEPEPLSHEGDDLIDEESSSLPLKLCAAPVPPRRHHMLATRCSSNMNPDPVPVEMMPMQVHVNHLILNLHLAPALM